MAPIKNRDQFKDKLHHLWTKNNDPVHFTGNLPIALNSPLAYEGLVYVGHNGGKMIAYDLENGKKVWKLVKI